MSFIMVSQDRVSIYGFALLLLFGTIAMLPQQARGAINIVDSAALQFEQGSRDCGRRLEGQPLIQCIAEYLDSFASRASTGDVPIVAPQAAPTIREAAQGVRQASQVQNRATAKARATSVMNRARSVARQLAARSSGQAKQVYSRVASAFSRAAGVIRREA